MSDQDLDRGHGNERNYLQEADAILRKPTTSTKAKAEMTGLTFLLALLIICGTLLGIVQILFG